MSRTIRNPYVSEDKLKEKRSRKNNAPAKRSGTKGQEIDKIIIQEDEDLEEIDDPFINKSHYEYHDGWAWKDEDNKYRAYFDEDE